MQLLLEKDRFYTWSLERGYPVPRTWSGSEHRRIPAEAFPLVAKPTYRRISSDDPKANELSQQMDQLRLTIFWNRTELESFIRNQADVLDHLLVQEYVRGLSDSMYTIGVYADRQNEVLGMFTGRKVRGFPPDIGNCIVGQAEEMPHHLKDIVRELCRELAYHGIAEFEFKQDAITGEFKLIEVNPRSWSWVGITPACGVSLPWIAFADLSGAEPVTYTESSVPSGSAKWVILYEDLLNCLYFNRQEGYPEWHMSLRQWWHSLKAEHRVVADIAFDDPLPGLYGAYATTRRALQRRRSYSSNHRHG
jgi:predicted ATP-grasp superfamily ATP-dependent carboligase